MKTLISITLLLLFATLTVSAPTYPDVATGTGSFGTFCNDGFPCESGLVCVDSFCVTPLAGEGTDSSGSTPADSSGSTPAESVVPVASPESNSSSDEEEDAAKKKEEEAKKMEEEAKKMEEEAKKEAEMKKKMEEEEMKTDGDKKICAKCENRESCDKGMICDPRLKICVKLVNEGDECAPMTKCLKCTSGFVCEDKKCVASSTTATSNTNEPMNITTAVESGGSEPAATVAVTPDADPALVATPEAIALTIATPAATPQTTQVVTATPEVDSTATKGGQCSACISDKYCPDGYKCSDRSNTCVQMMKKGKKCGVAQECSVCDSGLVCVDDECMKVEDQPKPTELPSPDPSVAPTEPATDTSPDASPAASPSMMPEEEMSKPEVAESPAASPDAKKPTASTEEKAPEGAMSSGGSGTGIVPTESPDAGAGGLAASNEGRIPNDLPANLCEILSC